MLPAEYVPADRSWSLSDEIVWWSTGSSGTEIWSYKPGDAQPQVIFTIDANDSSVGEIVGRSGRYAFPEANDRLYGEGAWKLWYLPAAGKNRVLLDEGQSSSRYLPTLAMDDRLIVWAALDDPNSSSGGSQPDGDVSSAIRLAATNDLSEVTTLVSYRAIDGLLWYPALNGDEVWFGIIHGDWQNGVQDDIRVQTLDLSKPAAEPITFRGVGREFNPAADDRFVVWKSPEPGFSALNWGDIYVLDRASGARTHVSSEGGRPSLGRRFIAFDVITHRQLSLFDLQTGVLTRPVNLSNAGAQTVDGANVRGDLLTFFRQDGTAPPEIGWAVLPH